MYSWDLDESRVVFYLSFAHTRWETHLSAPAVCRAARLARSTRARKKSVASSATHRSCLSHTAALHRSCLSHTAALHRSCLSHTAALHRSCLSHTRTRRAAPVLAARAAASMRCDTCAAEKKMWAQRDVGAARMPNSVRPCRARRDQNHRACRNGAARRSSSRGGSGCNGGMCAACVVECAFAAKEAHLPSARATVLRRC
jgi:hypothetical protein